MNEDEEGMMICPECGGLWSGEADWKTFMSWPLCKECASKLKVDLGCGKNKKKDFVGVGFVGVDRSEDSDADVIHDLNVFPYPFKGNSVDEIYLCHTLEHLNEPTKVIEECWRILKNEGKLTVRVPWYRGLGAFVDIDHKCFFCEHSMDKFVEGHPDAYQSKARFNILRIEYTKNPAFAFLPLKLLKHWIYNGVLAVDFYLEAIK